MSCMVARVMSADALHVAMKKAMVDMTPVICCN
jgi:hypothetical protein